MADNTYTFAIPTGPFGTVTSATDDGSGNDIVVIGPGSYGANAYGLFTLSIFLAWPSAASPANPLHAQVTYIDPVSGAISDHLIYGAIENARGGAGADAIIGSASANMLWGDQDNVAGGNDSISGEGGNDTIYGMGGVDTLQGGDGDDDIWGDGPQLNALTQTWSQPGDLIEGGNGFDTIHGGFGNDTVDGGAGHDMLDYSGFGFGPNLMFSVGIDLALGTAGISAWLLSPSGVFPLGTTSFTSIEDASGGAGNDYIAGANYLSLADDPTSYLRGNGGDDTLLGRTRQDIIFGDDGNDDITDGGSLPTFSGPDMLYGGKGDDIYRLHDDGMVFEDPGAGHDTIELWANLAMLLPAEVEDLLMQDAAGAVGATGNGLGNAITGNASVNQIGGGDGNDTVAGLGGNDVLKGQRGADSLLGGADADQLDGGAGKDTLLGEDGTDKLLGGADGDLLRGGLGSDTQTGGSGADTFLFITAGEAGKGADRDKITDFLSGTDKLDLAGIMAGQTFIGGQGFHKLAGEIRYVQATGILSGDLNGDAKADWQLELGAGTLLVGTDLILV